MRRFALLSAVIAFAGCSSKTGSVAFVPTGSSASALTETPVGPEGSAITRVRVLINEAEFNKAGEAAAADGGCVGGHGGHGSSGGGAPVAAADGTEQGPFVLTLDAAALAGGTGAAVVLSDVPADTYDGTELEIAPYGTDADGRTLPTTAEFDDFRTSGNTVIVDGTWGAVAYTFSAAIVTEQVTTATVVVTDGAQTSLSFVLDDSAWFTAADGSVVDPTVAANHDAIAANIKASLTVNK